jgi:hypothetical protein
MYAHTLAEASARVSGINIALGILVRNDAARNKLRREVGDIGLIM